MTTTLPARLWAMTVKEGALQGTRPQVTTWVSSTTHSGRGIATVDNPTPWKAAEINGGKR